MDQDILRNKAEYLLLVIDNFAREKGLTEDQAYRYIKNFGGVNLINRHYDIMHTLSFDDAMESMNTYIKRQGGRIE